ncbi:MAG: helicase HerA-like domain-containing protein, partial [Sphingomonas sp.]|uniref:helicase HerA-like domain-containing protein n=1 Tax=Sphingomonas sp. TaxID=28214 RepID=UPI003F7DC742
MADTTTIFIGAGEGGTNPQALELKRANRHGLIAGATGTGKTVTIQGIIDGLSQAGVPCFVADVKGDLSGLAMAGSPTAKNADVFTARAKEIGDSDWSYSDNPVQFWD